MRSSAKKYEKSATKYLQILSLTTSIVYRTHIQRCIPFHILYQCVKLINSNQFQLIPISNDVYNTITKDETIQSSNFIIVPENFLRNCNTKTLHWAELSHRNAKADPSILSAFIDPSFYPSINVPILTSENCPNYRALVRSDFYKYLLLKYDLSDDQENQEIYVTLKLLAPNEFTINLAKSATICLINNPYELTNIVIDDILKSYFRIARIIYRNYIHEIQLTETVLGSHLFSKYFNIFMKIKSIYFRCNQMDSDSNSMENIAIILKNATNLRQSSTVNASLPMHCINTSHHFNAICPTGLHDYFQKLQSSIYPFFHCNTINENSFSSGITPTFLLKGKRGIGKTTLVYLVGLCFGTQVYLVDCIDIVSQIIAQTETKIKFVMSNASLCQPIIICLRNFEVLTMDNEGREDARIISVIETELQRIHELKHNYPIVTIALTNEMKYVTMQRLFLETIEIESPTQKQREDFLHWFFTKDLIAEKLKNNQLNDLLTTKGKSLLNTDIETMIKTIAKNSQGFIYGDLRLLYENSIRTMKRNREPSITLDNLNTNLMGIQGQFSDSLGVPKVPTVLWSDIGGLSALKEDVQSSIELPLNYSHLMGGFKRSGILLYGPPGTGKTLIAKAVATECSLNFLSVQGPELLNMYVGQSEQNVREVFARARDAAPCVIFLDELDSLAPNRGATGDSGGVMDRVVSQLLAEMDRISTDVGPQRQIFILAATNRPDLIDPALLRPGRFDKLFYVGPCKTLEDKQSVIKAQIKKFKIETSLTIELIAKMLPAYVTGADVYSVCSNAWMNAARRKIKHHTKENKPFPSKVEITVKKEDFKEAIAKFVPSVLKKDLASYERLKETYSSDFTDDAT